MEFVGIIFIGVAIAALVASFRDRLNTADRPIETGEATVVDWEFEPAHPEFTQSSEGAVAEKIDDRWLVRLNLGGLSAGCYLPFQPRYREGDKVRVRYRTGYLDHLPFDVDIVV